MAQFHENGRKKGSGICLRFSRQLDRLVKAILSTIRDVDNLDDFALKTVIELLKHSSKHFILQADCVQQGIAVVSLRNRECRRGRSLG